MTTVPTSRRHLTRAERAAAKAQARKIRRGARRRTPTIVTAAAGLLNTLAAIYALMGGAAVYIAVHDGDQRRWITAAAAAVFCAVTLTYGVRLKKWARRHVAFPHQVTITEDPNDPGVLLVDLDALYATVRLIDPPAPVTVRNINDGRGLFTITDRLQSPRARHRDR